MVPVVSENKARQYPNPGHLAGDFFMGNASYALREAPGTPAEAHRAHSGVVAIGAGRYPLTAESGTCGETPVGAPAYEPN